MKLLITMLLILIASFLFSGCSQKIIKVPVEAPVAYGTPQEKPELTNVGLPIHIRVHGTSLTCFTDWQATNLAANILLLEQWGNSNYKQMKEIE